MGTQLHKNVDLNFSLEFLLYISIFNRIALPYVFCRFSRFFHR